MGEGTELISTTVERTRVRSYNGKRYVQSSQGPDGSYIYREDT